MGKTLIQHTSSFHRYLFDRLESMERQVFVFVDAGATNTYVGSPDEIAARNILPRMDATSKGNFLIIPYTEK